MTYQFEHWGAQLFSRFNCPRSAIVNLGFGILTIIAISFKLDKSPVYTIYRTPERFS